MVPAAEASQAEEVVLFRKNVEKRGGAAIAAAVKPLVFCLLNTKKEQKETLHHEKKYHFTSNLPFPCVRSVHLLRCCNKHVLPLVCYRYTQ